MVPDSIARRAVPKGGFLERYVTWASAVTDAPVAFHLASALSVLSATIDPDVLIPVYGGMPCTMWCMLVGEAGDSRKTTAGSLAYKMLRDVEPDLCSVGGYESEAKFLEDLGERPQLFMFYGEWAKFLAGTTAGSYKASMREGLLSTWDGNVIEKRSKGLVVTVERPRVSLLACVALGVLEKHTGIHDWTDGGMSRWILIHAKRSRLAFLPPWDEPTRVKLVEELRRKLDHRVGPCLGFTDKARSRVEAWARNLEKMGASSRDQWTRPTYARAMSVALKTAVTISSDIGNAGKSNGRPWYIDDRSMGWATHFADLHLASVVSTLGAIDTDRYGRERRAVLEAITGGLRSFPEVLRRCRPAMSLRHTKEILEHLKQSEAIFERAVPGSVHPHYSTSKEEADAGAAKIQREQSGNSVLITPKPRRDLIVPTPQQVVGVVNGQVVVPPVPVAPRPAPAPAPAPLPVEAVGQASQEYEAENSAAWAWE